MAEKKRRGPKHPGVVLNPPAGRDGWRAIWRDPDSGRRMSKSLSKLTTEEKRRTWAANKSAEIAKRIVDLETGAVRITSVPLGDALKRYFDAHPQLRPRTLEKYRNVSNWLERWAPTVGIETTGDLTRPKLMEFRKELIRAPKRVPVKGAGQGVFAASHERRGPASVNQDLRSVGTVLRYLVDLDLFSKLTHEDLRRALKKLDLERDVTDFLKATDCRRLVEAALRHDAETMISREEEGWLRKEAKRRRITRAALAELQPVGSTPCYEPIAPFVVFMLMTGMRFSEGVELTWSQVDLEAQIITLRGAGVKTRRGRMVGLEVSPGLQRLLTTMKLRSGGKPGARVFPSLGTLNAATRRLKRRPAAVDAKPVGRKLSAASERAARSYGAPESFSWQCLRRTCATYLVNSPGIFGAASVFRSAVQLGHSVVVAERSYLGVARGIPKDAKTLEDAMGIADLVEQVIAQAGGATAATEGGQVMTLTRSPVRGTI